MKKNLKPLKLTLFLLLLASLFALSLAACASQQPVVFPSPFLPAANTAEPTSTLVPTPTSTEIPPPPVVEVWLTLPDESKKLFREPDLQFLPGAAGENKPIELDMTAQYQKMEGFGASMTDSSAWLIMNALDETQRTQLMQNLFTRQEEGIGLSYVRIPMGASDFAFEDYSYDDMPPGEVDPDLQHFSIDHDKAYIIPALKLSAQLNPQLRFMGSPWSAPGWMKDSGSMDGGELLPEYYQAFANYHVRFVQDYAAEGVTIDSITPQNEPMYSTSNYPTKSIPASGQVVLVRDFIGPAFEQAGLKTRIVVFDHNWDLVDYPLEVLADSQVQAYVDGAAFHCYAGNALSQTRVHATYPNENIWFTECSGGRWAPRFSENLNYFLRTVMIGNFNNWGNSVMLWNLALDEKDGPQNGGCTNCRGVVTIDQSTGEVAYNVEYYTLGHFSKFVDPGAVRIGSSPGVNRLPVNVAFINPDGSIVLVAHADRTGTFDVSWNDMHFTYTLPERAAVTFKWQGPAQP